MGRKSRRPLKIEKIGGSSRIFSRMSFCAALEVEMRLKLKTINQVQRSRGASIAEETAQRYTLEEKKRDGQTREYQGMRGSGSNK